MIHLHVNLQKIINSKISQGLKIIKKDIIFEKNYWKINAAHDGYLKQYGLFMKGNRVLS